MQQQGADQSAFALGNGAYGKQCLSSFSVISVKVGASCTPRCATSMIFKATTRVAGSSINFIPNFQHMVSRASDICRTTSGSNAWPERNPRIGMIGSYKSFPRLLHAESYESE